MWNSLIGVPVLCEAVWLACPYCVKHFGVPVLCEAVWLTCPYCVKHFDWCACIVWNNLVCLNCVKQFDWCAHIVWNSLTGVPLLRETDWCAYVLSYSFLQLNVITYHQWWKCYVMLCLICWSFCYYCTAHFYTLCSDLCPLASKESAILHVIVHKHDMK